MKLFAVSVTYNFNVTSERLTHYKNYSLEYLAESEVSTHGLPEFTRRGTCVYFRPTPFPYFFKTLLVLTSLLRVLKPVLRFRKNFLERVIRYRPFRVQDQDRRPSPRPRRGLRPTDLTGFAGQRDREGKVEESEKVVRRTLFVEKVLFPCS